MQQPRTRRPFIVEIRSSRRTARQQDITSIWGSVDIAAASQIVSRELSGHDVIFVRTDTEKPDGQNPSK